VLVVNSGGGDPRALLEAVDLDVPVVDKPKRLPPGAVRNAGIAATTARFVAFLAADCLAEPGWVSERLRVHREGALAVALPMTNADSGSRSAEAAYLLLHHRRMPETPAGRRLLYGLSYDRSLFEQFGLFREDLRTGEDTEFNRRLVPPVRVEFAEGRTAHRHPTSFVALMRDQFERGVRRAVAEGRLSGAKPRRIAVSAGRNLIQSRRALRYVSDPARRHSLQRGLPLAVPATAAYALGALASPLFADRGSDPSR
jgi:hypothetical protein